MKLAMRNKTITELDLFDIARAQTIGPIHYGANIMDIGDWLGSPSYWGFSTVDKTFVSHMSFGEVEVGFATHNDIARVTYAKFYLENFKRNLIPFAKTGYKSETWIRNNFKSARPFYPSVDEAMRSASITFKTDIVPITPDETYAVMRFGKNLGFYFDLPDKKFELEKSRLWFVEIGAGD